MNSLWNPSFMQLNLHGSVVQCTWDIYALRKMKYRRIFIDPPYVYLNYLKHLRHWFTSVATCWNSETLAWSAGCFGFWSIYISTAHQGKNARFYHTYVDEDAMRWCKSHLWKNSSVISVLNCTQYSILGWTFLWTKKPTYCMVCLQAVLDFQNPKYRPLWLLRCQKLRRAGCRVGHSIDLSIDKQFIRPILSPTKKWNTWSIC